MSKKVLDSPHDQLDNEGLETGNAFGFMETEIPNELVQDELVKTKKVGEPELKTEDSTEILKKVLQIVMPLMYNLRDSADTSDTILWPNRKKELTKQINRINKITGNIYEEKD